MPHTFVIFGASGDLTRRKLVPALYQLHRKGRLPKQTRIVGFARSLFSHQQWRQGLADSVQEFVGESFEQSVWDEFSQRLFYNAGDINNKQDFDQLAVFLKEIEKEARDTRVYYLATAPRFYETAVRHLGEAGLANEAEGPRQVIVEKPFGTDLASAQYLNAAIATVFEERQIYRIDHYLGKETVQNLMVLRFANTIFEPIWNRNYIDHVQITVAESVDVGDRARYYDGAGVLRDMFQNHLLQLLMVTAMEAPIKYEPDTIRNEKVKVLQAIRPLVGDAIRQDTFRAQYRGYTGDERVDSKSRTATFAAVKLSIDNWRWHGVPFYLRSGKAMSCRSSQIVIQFVAPPHMMFADGPQSPAEANRLVIQVQPGEGIQLHFETKVPDAGMKLRQTDLDFDFCREFHSVMPGAYERLLLDALEGDASLFARADEVEKAWEIVDPVLEYWEARDQPSLFSYDTGQWGPIESTDWMARQNRQWFDSCPVLV